MTPIEYLEQRVAVLKAEQPESRAGRDALLQTIHELNNIILSWKLEAMQTLREAQQEAGIR
jgi:hypothetical protein